MYVHIYIKNKIISIYLYLYKMGFYTSCPYFIVLIISYFWLSPAEDSHRGRQNTLSQILQFLEVCLAVLLIVLSGKF